MLEFNIGIINNVQAKGKNSLTKKTCTLIITNERLICVPLTQSTLISAMIGSTLSGPSGSIAMTNNTKNKADNKFQNISENIEKNINKILKEETDSFEIKKTEITKGIMKTSFFSTLGIWIPLTIFTKKRFHFDIPIAEKENSKSIISLFSEKIIIK